MKTTKRIFACLLIVVMLASMLCVGASAVNINIANGEGTYTAYKVLDLEQNTSTDAFLYVVTDTSATTEWYDFITTNTAAKAFLKVTQKSGSVYYVEKADGADESKAIAFANAAYTYAETNGFASVSGTTSLNLGDGFYVMKSSAGTTAYAFTVIDEVLAGMDSNYSGTTITSKSDLPSITKTVDNAVAAKDEILNYTIVVAAKTGALNYTIRDNADAGITINTDGLNTIVWNDNGANKTLTKDADYTVTLNVDGSDFEIKFDPDVCSALSTGDTLTINYTGTLNAGATIGGNGNINTSTLYYGADSNSDSLPDITKDDFASVHTYKIVLNKTYDVGEPNDAAFTLYKKNNVGTYEALGLFTETTANTVFEFARLAEGEYKISETTVPAGYVPIADIEFTVSAEADSTLAEVFSTLSGGDFTADKAAGTLTKSVANISGNKLPETGGIGTTVFYAAGGMLVLGALVVLLMKKRTVTE